MNVNKIISEIDSEISRLQQVRSLLGGDKPNGHRLKRPGKKRTLSADARARIAAAQKRRWAKQKRQRA